MEQMNLFLSPETKMLEEISGLKDKLDKLRRSFFKRYEIEMAEMNKIENRIVILENANLDGKDRVHHSGQADTMDCAAGH